VDAEARKKQNSTFDDPRIHKRKTVWVTVSTPICVKLNFGNNDMFSGINHFDKGLVARTSRKCPHRGGLVSNVHKQTDFCQLMKGYLFPISYHCTCIMTISNYCKSQSRKLL